MTENTDGADSDTSSSGRDGNELRDWWDRSSRPSLTIVEAIAEATGRDLTALPPLHHSIDPEALNTLLTRDTQQEEHVQVSFTYDGALVSVGSDGDLTVRVDGTTHEATTDPETTADLETALEESIQAAYRNGLSVAGGYGVRNGSELPDWDVIITRVEKPSDADS